LVSILIPAYNESERIVSTLNSVQALPRVKEIVVVDDGSVDDTAVLAERAGARVIRVEHNTGKGGAVGAGLRHVTGDVVLLLDADLGDTAAEAARLLPPLFAGEADVTIASFPPAGKAGGFGIASFVARAGIHLLTGFDIKSPLSGQRAAWRPVFERIGYDFCPGYGLEVGMTVDMIRAGFRLLEVPVKMSHNQMGRTAAGFAHRSKQLSHILAALARKLGDNRRLCL